MSATNPVTLLRVMPWDLVGVDAACFSAGACDGAECEPLGTDGCAPPAAGEESCGWAAESRGAPAGGGAIGTASAAAGGAAGTGAEPPDEAEPGGPGAAGAALPPEPAPGPGGVPADGPTGGTTGAAPECVVVELDSTLVVESSLPDEPVLGVTEPVCDGPVVWDGPVVVSDGSAVTEGSTVELVGVSVLVGCVGTGVPVW